MKMNGLDQNHLSKRKFFLFGYRRKKIQIVLNGLERKREKLLKQIRSIQKELNRFIELAFEIRNRFFQDTDFMNSHEIEAEAWLDKGKFILAVDLLCFNQVSKQTMDFILSLPRNQKDQLIEFFKHGHSKYELLDQVINYSNQSSKPYLIRENEDD